MKHLLALLFLTISIDLHAQVKDLNKEWIELFNGKELKNWTVKIRGHKIGDNFGNTFRVKDGKIQVNYDKYEKFDGQFGHIFYKDKFSYYLLSLEYRFIGEQVKGGESWALRNSGVMIHAQSAETMKIDQDFPTSLEVQFLGGDGKDERSTGNLCTPGTNVVINEKLVTEHCINSNSKTYHGEQWVRVDVLVLGDSIIKHIVEKDTVIVYGKPQLGGDSEEQGEGTPVSEGYISLQSESHPIEFRKIKLFNLEKYSKNPDSLKQILSELASNNRR